MAAVFRPVLALGLTPEDAACLEALPEARAYEFFAAGDEAAVHDPALCRPRRYIADTLGQLRRRGRKIAGVIAFDDYPGSLLAAAIAEALGLPGPGLRASLCRGDITSAASTRTEHFGTTPYL